MGHTLACRTVNNVVQTMCESHFKSFEDFITEETERKWLVLLIVDDLTSIHTMASERSKINPLVWLPIWRNFLFFSQRIGLANSIVDKSYASLSISLSAHSLCWKLLQMNMTIFWLITPAIHSQHLLLRIPLTTVCCRTHHNHPFCLQYQLYGLFTFP